MAITRNYQYKILQDVDLSQNIIENPSLITNSKSLNIYSDNILTEEGSSVIIKDTNNSNNITVSSDNTTISGTKLLVNTTETDINSTTTISKDLTLIGSKFIATVPTTIEIGTKNISSTNLYGKDLEIKSSTTVDSGDSLVSADNISFQNKLSSNDIEIWWDSSRNSLMFSKK